eukprot:PLAT14757.1.p1 GENE.PLAT14757.1~~PLAT14757.1.p1  ORF type:complete len:631 (+),score=280.67 PLAT14757.1:23-1894(+)
MGKARRRGTSSKRRKRHGGGSGSAGGGSGWAAAGETDSLLTKLRSVKGKDRAAACVAIGSMLGGDVVGEVAGGMSESAEAKLLKRNLRGLVAAGAPKALTLALTDPTQDVRLHAAGALRNLTVVGGAPTAQALVDADVVTAALALLAEETTGAEAVLAGGGDAAVQLAQLVEQVLHVLANVAQHSESSVERLTVEGGLASALHFLCSAVWPVDTQQAAAQLLLVASENNELLAEQLRAEEGSALHSLLAIVAADGALPLLPVTVAGTLLNVRGSPEEEEQLMQACLPALLAALDTDAAAVLATEGDSKEDDCNWPALAAALPAQRRAAELLTNLAVSTDTMADLVDFDDDDLASAEAEAASGGGGEDASGVEMSPVLLRLAEEDTLSCVMRRLTESYELPLPDEPAGLPSDLWPALAGMQAALEGLTANLVMNLPAEALGEPTELLSFLLAQLQPTVGMHAREEVIATAASALLRRAGEGSWAMEASDDALGAIVALTEGGSSSLAPHNATTRASAASMLGWLGFMLPGAMDEVIVPALQTCLADGAMPVQAEALNAVFQLFAEDDALPGLRGSALVGQLEALLPMLSKKLRAEGSRLETWEHMRVKEAKLNLARFLEWVREG